MAWKNKVLIILIIALKHFLFQTLERFCNEVPKDEYRNEFNQGYFSQSSFKEVTCSAVRSTEIVTRGGSPSMHSMDPDKFLAIKK